MTLQSFILVLLSQICAVAGQIFMKKSVNHPGGDKGKGGTTLFVSGIVAMTVGFFLWLGLMSKFELSYLFPFQALHYLLVVIAAAIFLKEKASPSLLVGVMFISAGVALVSAN